MEIGLASELWAQSVRGGFPRKRRHRVTRPWLPERQCLPSPQTAACHSQPRRDDRCHFTVMDWTTAKRAGWLNYFAAVELAWDRDHDVVYLIGTYRQKETTPIIHSSVLRRSGRAALGLAA